MKTLNAVIVDDEAPGRELICELLEDVPQIQVKKAFGKPSEALQYLNGYDQTDLLFLDIQMPGMSGFDLLRQLTHPPKVIFSTAFDQYAIKAFEVHAVDYLLKPYDRTRFHAAIGKFLQTQESEQQREIRLKQFLNHQKQSANYPDRFFVRSGVNIKPVHVDDIILIEADGDYARIVTQTQTLLSSTGLSELENRLDPSAFLRTHRSFIIGYRHVQNLESDGSGGYYVTLSDGREAKVSRSKAELIRNTII